MAFLGVHGHNAPLVRNPGQPCEPSGRGLTATAVGQLTPRGRFPQNACPRRSFGQNRLLFFMT
jgi:hypothetical protein